MIEQIKQLSKVERERVITLLQTSFEAYAKRGEAEAETDALCAAEKVLLVKRHNGVIVGLIGAQSQYGLTGWELHPLLVESTYQRRGFGKALVLELEQVLRDKGALVIYLGTDDEHFRTSLSTGDLFTETFTKIQQVQNLADHPYSFYERCGYHIVGVIPDANGWHKPDILMAKRLHPYKP